MNEKEFSDMFFFVRIQIYKMRQRLKISNFELSMGLFLMLHREDDLGKDTLRYCQDLTCDTAGKEPKNKEKIIELLKYTGHHEVIDSFKQWNLPNMPVNGVTLLEAGVPRGRKLAIALDALRKKWKESNYTSTREQLLEHAADFVKK